MEAKGCAKPAVWKNARRHFYWAVRARIAKSVALANIAEASPNSTVHYRTRLLDSLVQIEPQSDYRKVAEALENLDLSQTVTQLKADHLMRRLIDLTKEDRKATLDGLMRLFDHLTSEEKASLMTVLQSRASPGGFPSPLPICIH